jgi:hypothetical protein
METTVSGLEDAASCTDQGATISDMLLPRMFPVENLTVLPLFFLLAGFLMVLLCFFFLPFCLILVSADAD